MPVGVRAGIASDEPARQVARRILADPRRQFWQTFRKVILPLLRPAILAALVYSFVRAMTAIRR
jgi:iron(III) transport system permease protein